MKPLLRILLAVLALITNSQARAEQQLTLGVLALRPEPMVQSMWQPFADYLGAGLGREVHLEVLHAEAMRTAIARNELDLVLTNPTHLVELRSLSPLSGARGRLARRVQARPGLVQLHPGGGCDGGRRCGSFSRQRRIVRSTIGSMSRVMEDGGVGCASRCRRISSGRCSA